MGEFSVLGLRVVREAARSGSFSTAAERLGYTQSAVSRQVALMELAAGRALFERHARGVRVTAAGQIVLRHAEVVLGELDSARERLDRLDDRPATVRVGAFSTAMAALVPRAIALTPARILLREGTSARLLTALGRGRLELAVVTAAQPLPGAVVVEHLTDDPLLIAVAPGHRLAGQRGVTPAQLRDERWIAGSSEVGGTLLGAWHDPDHDPDIAFVARDWFAKLGLVATGMGITVVPGIAVPLLPPTVAVVRIDHPAAVRTTVLARGPRISAAAAAFVDATRESAAGLAIEIEQRTRGTALG
ncbi:LysR family transcriptional regulator [Nocardia nova]|uniref:LysR family transcriptional regulator n=1 Tax=Nocardia nova TaxID=37330 RepID=UPI0034100C0A